MAWCASDRKDTVNNMKTKNGIFKEGTNELLSYEKKGTKKIKTLNVSAEIFEYFYNMFSNHRILCTTKSLETFNNCSYGLWQHAIAIFYANPEVENGRYRIIAPGLYIAYMEDEVETKFPAIYEKTYRGSYDYMLVCDSSLKTSDVNNDIVGITGIQARTWGKKEIEKNYTKEEVETIIDQCEETRPMPFRHRQNTEDDAVVEFDNCVYMDIHKAHNSELIKLFPKCKNFYHMYEKALKYKAAGDKVNAKKCKDYPNLLVGCFNQHYRADDSLGNKKGDMIKWLYGLDTHKIYNHIVTNIYNKITAQYNNLKTFESTLVYAQTDGLIVSNPNWVNVKDSDELGDFGIEPIDDKKVWTYHYKPRNNEETGYCIYQYFENGEKIVKGDLPDSLKPLIDLSKGQVVVYKKSKDEFGYIQAKLIAQKTITVREND